MALSLEQKQVVVKEVSAVAAEAFSAVAAEYRGLTVGEMNELRVAARTQGVYLRVVKNTLAKKAFEGTEFECMNDGLAGPMIFALSQEDPGSAGRVIKDFAKEHNKLIPILLAVGGQALPGSEIDKLAKLPTKDQAISMLMSVMIAPIEKFVRTLNEPHAKLVRTIAAVRDQKQDAA